MFTYFLAQVLRHSSEVISINKIVEADNYHKKLNVKNIINVSSYNRMYML